MRPPCTRCADADEKCSGLPGEKCGRCKRNHGKCSHATRTGRGGGSGGPTTATTSALGEAAAGGEGTAAGAVDFGEEEDSDEEDDVLVERLVASGSSVQESPKSVEKNGDEGDDDMENGSDTSGKKDATMDVDEEAEDAAPAAGRVIETPAVAASQPQTPVKGATGQGHGRTHRGDVEIGDLGFENLESLNLDEESKKMAVALKGQMQGIDMAKMALDRELEKLSERLREVLGRARV